MYRLYCDLDSDEEVAMFRFVGQGDGPVFDGGSISASEIEGLFLMTDGVMLDFMYMKPGVLACSHRAKTEMASILGDAVQFVNVGDGMGGSVDVINITNVIDLIDKERSGIKYLPDGRVMKIDPFHFKGVDEVDGHIFKIPETSHREIYVDARFKEWFDQSGLSGLVFEIVSDE